MKKVLFINPGHIKSITDTYAYCSYLKNRYDITYLGFEENQNNCTIDGVKIIYIKGFGNTLLNKYKYLRLILKITSLEQYDFIFIHYYKGVSLLRIFGLKNAYLDVRSSYIHRSNLNRYLFNKLLLFEAFFFKNLTVISEGLKEYLRLPSRAKILPLGADFISSKNRTTGFKTLYVGTFHERNIANTIRAFAKFIFDCNISTPSKATFTIIGYGSEDETHEIIQTIADTKMGDFIKYLGVVRYPELSNYLLCHNVGISYIPIKDHFKFQPPTKTFEYLLNGLVVIGTKTYEHIKLVNGANGVLVNDDIGSFCDGIKYVYENFNKFDLTEIQTSSAKYTWENIISNNLIPLIESV